MINHKKTNPTGLTKKADNHPPIGQQKATPCNLKTRYLLTAWTQTFPNHSPEISTKSLHRAQARAFKKFTRCRKTLRETKSESRCSSRPATINAARLFLRARGPMRKSGRRRLLLLLLLLLLPDRFNREAVWRYCGLAFCPLPVRQLYSSLCFPPSGLFSFLLFFQSKRTLFHAQQRARIYNIHFN